MLKYEILEHDRSGDVMVTGSDYANESKPQSDVKRTEAGWIMRVSYIQCEHEGQQWKKGIKPRHGTMTVC